MAGKAHQLIGPLEYPIARVVPLLTPAHLDRDFDYWVPLAWDAAAQPGVRVRVRFGGQVVDGFVLARLRQSDFSGELRSLAQVVSPERVLTPELAQVVSQVARRWVGTRADVLRLAIPPRHARTEKTSPGSPVRSDKVGPEKRDTAAWERYRHAASFLHALEQGKCVRAAWQAIPGEHWPRRLAEVAAVVAATGRGVIVLVPDQRDLNRVLTECVGLVGEAAVGLAAGLGPAQRYRRWLAVLRGTARIVVGTRSAVWAPVQALGLVIIWDDGDDNYAEPRAPYPHAREVALLRAHTQGASLVAAGFARTAEIQALVESGWVRDLVAERTQVRTTMPRITAPGDSDQALYRDPLARAVRIPAVAFDVVRAALAAGEAVLVQVPRRGYVPALACRECRTPARCRWCHGPLELSQQDDERPESPRCRWCGRADTRYRCAACGGRALRAVTIGAQRTAEELGRAFAGVPIRGSQGAAILDTVPAGAQVVVATVGAEPVVPGGYGAGLLLDGWALLGRADLRAAEDAFRRWSSAAALVKNGGRVIVAADPGSPTVQAFVRWDPVGHARRELSSRAQPGFPPAVRMAALDGPGSALSDFLAAADLPATVDVLGPVPLPAAARPPAMARETDIIERLLLRTPRACAPALTQALRTAQTIRSARGEVPIRVQIDPIDIG